MPSKKDFKEILDTAFDQYFSTLELLQTWLPERKNMQEFIILSCARLDSLSNLAFPKGGQEENFVKFLTIYSNSRRDLEKVSLPDLYWFLMYHDAVLPGTISKPGRLRVFEPKRDRDLIKVVWQSEIAITERDIGRLLRFFLRQLKKHYRVVPNQSLNKSSHDTAKSIRHRLEKGADSYKNDYYRKAVKFIGTLLDRYKLAALLYREYRCGAIHEYKVDLDEREFFTKQELYWSAIWSDMVEPSRFLGLRFPGPFLLKLLGECIRNFKANLINRRKLPADVFFKFCDLFDDMDYLDEESIASGKDLSLTIESK
jgi:hypothetical protein